MKRVRRGANLYPMSQCEWPAAIPTHGGTPHMRRWAAVRSIGILGCWLLAGNATMVWLSWAEEELRQGEGAGASPPY
jgi:hypothetical protein